MINISDKLKVNLSQSTNQVDTIVRSSLPSKNSSSKPGSDSDSLKVSICVITYKRPAGLKRLLKGINQLNFRKVSTPEIEVVIVDNDTSSIAEQVVKEISKDFQWSLKTNVESQRGISYARNKSLACAATDSDFIALIDDDEVPKPSWLDELLFAQQKYAADIVTGPVTLHFSEKNIPNWIIKGKFLEPPRYQTGEERQVAFTNNVLVRVEILRKYNPIFDNRFALTGGEDSHLFMRLYQAGYKIVWTDEAVVQEWVPPSRTQLQYILLRGYNSWLHHSLIEKELYPSLMRKIIRLLKGFALISRGVIKLTPSLLTLLLGKQFLVHSLLDIFRGLGTLSGLLGVNYKAYEKSH